MSITLTDPATGNDVPVFLGVSGGMVDAVIRAANREAFRQAALSVRILVQQDDPEDDTTIRPGQGVTVDEIGPVTLTPAVIDEDGNVTTPAVMDDRWHVNVRLTGYALDDIGPDTGVLRWHLWGLAWSKDGAPDPQLNAAEEARVLYDVALIDPDTIASPSRVFL